MKWRNEERIELLGAKIDTDPASRVASEEERDCAFRARYCSERVRFRLCAARVSDRTARLVVDRLAEIAPEADHASPRWAVPEPMQPLIVVGRATLYERVKPTALIRKPRFGLWASKGHLYIWADRETVKSHRNFSSKAARDACWVDWNPETYRTKMPVDRDGCAAPGPDCVHPLYQGPVFEFLVHLAEKIAASPETDGARRLHAVLGVCRDRMDDPEDWTAIYPRLTEALLDSGPEGDEPVPQQCCPPPRTGPAGSSASPAEPDKTSNSMLDVVRAVAIARVRTALPGFDREGLNRWVMETGYAPACSPHVAAADLLYVYAASVANAGGRKPNPDMFGALIRAAMSPLCSGGRIMRVPSLKDLALACRANLGHDIGSSFAGDICAIADGGLGRPLMRGLLKSVIEFCEWLCEFHGGDAATLHAALTAHVESARVGIGFDVLRRLDRLSWVGIAVAANFVKDSQVPGLRARGLTPAQAAGCVAGWFAKPDLHVARMMGYITGRIPQPGCDLRRWKLGQVLAACYRDPSQNFCGMYDELIRGDGNDMKVIADVQEWAFATHTSPLEIDRILYLIGARKVVVDGIEVNANGYPEFVDAVDAAVKRGVRRKS
jgi:hypothetical protein